MIGVRDLTSHLLYVSKELGVENFKLRKTGLNKVVFLSLAKCYKYGVKVKYDILFKKSIYGAFSRDVDSLLGGVYARAVNYEYAKENSVLSANLELNEEFKAMIIKESENPLSHHHEIVNSEVFKNSKFAENSKIAEYDSNYLLLSMNKDIVWTLKEILELAGVDEEEAYDLRVPVKKEDMKAIRKYIEVYHDRDKRISFTFDDIDRLRRMSSSLLDSVILHGLKQESGTR